MFYFFIILYIMIQGKKGQKWSARVPISDLWELQQHCPLYQGQKAQIVYTLDPSTHEMETSYEKRICEKP